ncbi:hypothetical protein [Lactonifactor longoviformis]|uniref:hypothetical protein n=1 Tax=Lactonifactor longoviformis TaxID=341220 RepID=UPI001A9A514C|nr:hypothetical protein [Lactonifactor longoviformis]
MNSVNKDRDIFIIHSIFKDISGNGLHKGLGRRSYLMIFPGVRDYEPERKILPEQKEQKT